MIRLRFSSEAAGGIALMAAATLALIVANGPFRHAYAAALDAQAGPLAVRHWIDDGLMTIFFLAVGLEMKRELLIGQLARWSDRTLPMIAALAGMIVPALVYLALVGGDPALARGWAIPAATDIAFAVGVLALLGRRVPASLKLLLTAIAIIDDIGAVLAIALFYTAGLDLAALASATAILAAMLLLARRGVAAPWPYLLLGVGLWLAVLLSGVHATIAGVLTGLAIPRRGGEQLLHRLEPWVAFAILPLFAFANAGLSLAGLGALMLTAPLTLAVALGLFAGKQIGVFAALRIAVATGMAARPAGAGWWQLYGIALLCGIGFTMSLFVGGLAFADAARIDAVKLGVLGGSLLSALAGYAVLRCTSPPRG